MKKPTLSKSKFITGWQCHKRLWWHVNEKNAPELAITTEVQDVLDQGTDVGAVAREQFQGGILIDRPITEYDERRNDTQTAIKSNASVIYEATFVADGVYVAVDILHRNKKGWTLTEVKSSTHLSDYHIPDVAIQAYVLRKCGVNVTQVELMHLDREYRVGKGNPFITENVTTAVDTFMPEVAPEIRKQKAMLKGTLPAIAIGEQCNNGAGGKCPFIARCWPKKDIDSLQTLNNLRTKKKLALLEDGYSSIKTLPKEYLTTATHKRQQKALIENKTIVEKEIRAALAPLRCNRIGFLDFETIVRALPIWKGLAPWAQIPVQFSYHEQTRKGKVTHTDWLAQPGVDPRPEFIRQMIKATEKADKIVVYGHFEHSRIKELMAQFPKYAKELQSIDDRLFDLLPVMKKCIYHPLFAGSFSLKAVLSPVVPGLSYKGLAIKNGALATVHLAHLILKPEVIKNTEKMRKDLLAYCERDTFATVELVNKLRVIMEKITYEKV